MLEDGYPEDPFITTQYEKENMFKENPEAGFERLIGWNYFSNADFM